MADPLSDVPTTVEAEMPPAAEAAPSSDVAAEVAVEEPAAAAQFSGRIEGGWGFVGAAYGISLSVLLVYVLVVHQRLRTIRRRKQGEA